MKHKYLLTLALLPSSVLLSQDDASDAEEEIFELSPFTVTSSEDEGYQASQTLAGSRLKTNVKDIATSVQILTEDFLDDVGADGVSDLFLYTTNTEAAGINGNFSDYSVGETSIGDERSRVSPQSSQRIRGLSRADLTRSYFSTLIPSDRFNTQMVEVNRGANSILYGLGSPAGIVNTTLKTASFENSSEIEHRFDSEGTQRIQLDLNRELIEEKLAVRVALLRDETNYYQQPAFENDDRIYVYFNARLWKGSAIRAFYEEGEREANRPSITPPATTIPYYFDSLPVVRNSVQSILDEAGVLDVDGNPLTLPSNYAFGYNAYAQDLYTGNYLTKGDLNKDGLADATDDALRIAMATNRVVFHNDPSNRYVFHPNLSRGILHAFDYDSPTSIGAVQTNNNSNNFRPKLKGGVPDALDPSGNGKFAYNYQATVQPWRQDSLLVPQGISNLDVFDFTRHLISGEAAFQNDEWDQHNVAFEQTFLENHVGFELAYDKQNYERDSFVPFQGYTGIFIDMMQNYYGEDNPNYGRPFVANRTDKRGVTDERETTRLTAFAKFAPSEIYPDSKIARWLGEHTFTGLLNKYEQTDAFSRWTQYYTETDAGSTFSGNDATGSGRRKYNYMVYLSDQNLTELSSADQVRLKPLTNQSLWQPGKTATIQSIDPDSGELYDLTVTADAFLDQYETNVQDTDTEAINWNGYFFDRHLVGLFGWRRDTAYTANYLAATGPDNLADLDNIGLASGGEEIEAQTVSWSAVYHVPFMPKTTSLSLHYGESENFSLAARPRDFYGTLIDSPSGQTKEYGISLGLFDNKLIARANWFETGLLNSGLSGQDNVYSKFVNQGILKPYGFLLEAEAYGFEAPSIDPDTSEELPGTPNYDLVTQELNKLRAIIPSSILAEANLGGVDASGIAQRNDIVVGDTADIKAEGFEVELTYNPSKAWRIALNVAKQETVSDNFSPRMKSLLDMMEPYFGNVEGTAGSLADLSYFNNVDATPPDVMSGPTVELNSVAQWLEENVYSVYRAKKSQEGKVSNEQRKWRANLVTNYTFREGALKGFGLGTAYRWQDGAAIGYPTIINEQGLLISDIDNPHIAPPQSNVDAWLRYKRKIFNDKINWTVEFRVQNLNTDADELIPVVSTTDSDYNVAVWRVGSPRIWRVSNSFEF